MKIKQIIFDFDGVIVNSHKIKTKGFYYIFRNYGKKNAQKAQTYHLKNTGSSRYVKFNYILKNIINIKKIKNEQINQLDIAFSKYIENKFQKLKINNNLLKFLKSEYKNYKFFISSGTPQRDINKILNKLNIGKYFVKAYGSPSKKVNHIKNIKKKNSLNLFVGDSLEDYNSAKKMGIPFILKINSENIGLRKKYKFIKISSFKNFKKKVSSIL